MNVSRGFLHITYKIYHHLDKLEGVHYNRLITPLLKAIQDQKKEIDDLKAEVAALKGS